MVARIDLTTSPDAGGQVRRRTIRLAGVVVALTALVELTGGVPQFGVNLFTAEALLAGAALVLLGVSVSKLAVAG
jgi:hypothetical protein